MLDKQILDNEGTWLELTDTKLNVGAVYDWATLASCGAVVVFSGTVRDHADGRVNVTSLTYEAYDDQVISKLKLITVEMRLRWSDLGRIALIHRVGELLVSESSVLVAVSSPHRADSFSAAQFAIDTLKLTIPIWKQEHWKDGSDWGTNSQDISSIKKNKPAETSSF